MKFLRLAAAMSALVMLALTPTGQAFAETSAPAVSATSPSSPAEALDSLLAVADAGGDPIESEVLDGVRAFYAARHYDLLWLKSRETTPQMTALRTRMDGAASYGLDPADYPTPMLAPRYVDDPALLAAADLEFTRAVARFVTHVSSGRLRPSDISSIITLGPEHVRIGESLARLARVQNVEAALSIYEPHHPQYLLLKQKLAELLAAEADDTRVVIPEGALLRPGAHDERVPQLRLRMGLTLEVRAEPNLYDAALVSAVEAFQEESALTVDGIVGPRTLLALNGVSPEDQIATITANLERWRWMPRDLGDFHIMVNVPEFVVRVVDHHTVVHTTRVVVGAPGHRTPIFSHVMSHLVVNPYWNVPTSIVSNEMLPEIRQNPGGYFARHGYQVLVESGGRSVVVDPGSINWGSVNPRSIHIRQVPGDANALGRIKFMFPNQYSVYLHDTPSKALFERDFRAYSHGCVRVDNPLDFADAILPTAAPEWNSARLEALYGGRERRINLDHPIPVHIAYFTMWVDETGELRRFEDVYGYDSEMRSHYGV